MQARSARFPLLTRCALAIVVALVAAGCSLAVEPKACTDMGCDDGLMVQFDAAPPAGAVRVELLPAGETGPRYVVDCPAVQGCPAGVWFPGFTGDYAVVRVTTSDGSVSREIRPTYATLQPNGPDCPPVCRTGAVTISLRN